MEPSFKRPHDGASSAPQKRPREQAAVRLTAHRALLEGWVVNKLQKFDTDEAVRARQAAAHASREGYEAHLRAQCEEEVKKHFGQGVTMTPSASEQAMVDLTVDAPAAPAAPAEAYPATAATARYAGLGGQQGLGAVSRSMAGGGARGGGSSYDAVELSDDESDAEAKAEAEDSDGDVPSDEEPPAPEKAFDSVFVPFEAKRLPEEIMAAALPHVGDVVEPRSLNSVPGPLITYQTKIPLELIRAGRLSALQTETVLYAGQRFNQMLADDITRGGFMLGDGTGVGKGRTITGVIFDRYLNWVEERKDTDTNIFIAVWISASWDLCEDARRDTRAVTAPLGAGAEGAAAAKGKGRKKRSAAGGQDPDSGNPLKVVSLKDLAAGSETIPCAHESKMAKNGTRGYILYGTYSMFSRGEESKGLKKLYEIIGKNHERVTNEAQISTLKTREGSTFTNKAGSAFDSVICFDEAHNAKNLVATRGKKSKTGEQVLELQQEFPNARILYSTATGASQISHLGYMDRIGLWGEGTPFTKFTGGGYGAMSFLEELKSGGIGAMELVAMDLKARGVYVARSLSFRGTTFEMSIAKLTGKQRETWDVCCSILHRLVWLSKGGKHYGPLRRGTNKLLWGAQQLFSRQLLSALKVPHAIKLIKEALERKESVILGVQLTSDSKMVELLKALAAKNLPEEKNQRETRRLSVAKETLRGIVEKCWCEAEDIDPLIVKQMMSGTDIAQIAFPQGQNQHWHRCWQQLVEKVDSLELPPSPIDAILQEFGPDQVAEVTGRKLMGVLDKDGNLSYINRTSRTAQNAGRGNSSQKTYSAAQINLAEQRAFVDGNKRIIIISQAGSQGISLHAALDSKNQQKRLHIILEMPWSSERMVQQCGRSHRSNQRHQPRFLAVVTDIAGETRFAMSIASRMASLGALTRGDKRAGGAGAGGALKSFDFSTSAGRKALKLLMQEMHVHALLDIGLKDLSGMQSHHGKRSAYRHCLDHVGAHGDVRCGGGSGGGCAGTTMSEAVEYSQTRFDISETASKNEIRAKFVECGTSVLVSKLDHEAALRNKMKSNALPKEKQQAQWRYLQAATQFSEVMAAFRVLSQHGSLPVEWSPEQNSLYAQPVRRAIATFLLVWRRKMHEGQYNAGLWDPSRTQAGALDPIFSSIFGHLSKSWMHPPPNSKDILTHFLLLDVVRAPDKQPHTNWEFQKQAKDVYGRIIPFVEDHQNYGYSQKKKGNMTVEGFFNKMLALRHSQQQEVFDYYQELHDVVAQHEVATQTSKSTRKVVIEKAVLLYKDPCSKSPVEYLQLATASKDDRLCFADARALLRESTGQEYHRERVGFFEQLKSGRIVVVVQEDGCQTFALWGAKSRLTATKRGLNREKLATATKRFNKISEQEAARKWKASWRKQKPPKTQKHHVVSGPVLMCWHLIKQFAETHDEGDVETEEATEKGMSKADGVNSNSMTILSAETRDGRRLIGVVIRKDMVGECCTNLQNIGKYLEDPDKFSQEQAQAKEIQMDHLRKQYQQQQQLTKQYQQQQQQQQQFGGAYSQAQAQEGGQQLERARAAQGQAMQYQQQHAREQQQRAMQAQLAAHQAAQGFAFPAASADGAASSAYVDLEEQLRAVSAAQVEEKRASSGSNGRPGPPSLSGAASGAFIEPVGGGGGAYAEPIGGGGGFDGSQYSSGGAYANDDSGGNGVSGMGVYSDQFSPDASVRSSEGGAASSNGDAQYDEFAAGGGLGDLAAYNQEGDSFYDLT